MMQQLVLFQFSTYIFYIFSDTLRNMKIHKQAYKYIHIYRNFYHVVILRIIDGLINQQPLRNYIKYGSGETTTAVWSALNLTLRISMGGRKDVHILHNGNVSSWHIKCAILAIQSFILCQMKRIHHQHHNHTRLMSQFL